MKKHYDDGLRCLLPSCCCCGDGIRQGGEKTKERLEVAAADGRYNAADMLDAAFTNTYSNSTGTE